MVKPILVKTFAKMVKNKKCTIEQLPEEYREPVKNFLNGNVTDSKPKKEEKITTPTIEGAISIPNSDNIKIDHTLLVNGVDIPFFVTDIFTEELLKGKPMPMAMDFTVLLVENTYGRFTEIPKVSVIEITGGFAIRIKGNTNTITTGADLLRVDIGIKSKNYEDMRMSMYFKAK